MSETKSFVRGRQATPKSATSITPKTPRERNLFDDTFIPSSHPSKKKPKSKSASKSASKLIETDIDLLPELSYNDVKVGDVLLGVISAVQDLRLRISLPGRMSGSVSVDAVSDAYTARLRSLVSEDKKKEAPLPLHNLFNVGQTLICAVVDVSSDDSGFKRIALSLSPEHVQANLRVSLLHKGLKLIASVASVEDHGLILDLGLGQKQGFLGEESLEKEPNFDVGSQINVVVDCDQQQIQEGRVIAVSAKKKSLNKATVDLSVVPAHALVPGMSVRASVVKRLNNGFKVKLLNKSNKEKRLDKEKKSNKEKKLSKEEMMESSVFGYVHDDHADLGFPESEGSLVRLTLLYRMPVVNTMFFTNRKFEDAKPFIDAMECIGNVIHNAQVVSDERRGLRLKFDTNEKSINKKFSIDSAFVPGSQVSRDANNERVAKKGDKVTCKIIQYDPIGNLFIASLLKSKIKNVDLDLKNFKIGNKLTNCVVKKHVGRSGVQVSLGSNDKITAFIPLLHLSDIPLTNYEKKFGLGQKLDVCRVISCVPERRRLILTHKSELMDDFHIIDTIDEEHVNKMTKGTVARILEKGILLEFFGNVKAWLPRTETKVRSEERLDEIFFEGQVLKCRIIAVTQQKKMVVTLLPDKLAKYSALRGKKSSRKRNQPMKEMEDEEGNREDNEVDLKENENNVENEMDTNNEYHEDVEMEKEDKDEKKERKKRKGSNEEDEDNVLSKKKKKKDKKFKEEEVVRKDEKKLKKKEKKENNYGEEEDKDEKEQKEDDKKLKKEKKLEKEEKEEKKLKSKVEQSLKKKQKKEGKQEKKEKDKEVLVKDPGWQDDFDPWAKPEEENTDKISPKIKSSSSSEKKKKHLSKSDKKALNALEQSEIERREENFIKGQNVKDILETQEDFERLVVGEPNRSDHWIRFMAFFGEKKDLKKAREVVKRALERIHFREELERFNVYMAWLNLELMLDKLDAWRSVLKEALQCTDEYRTYAQSAAVLERHDQLEEAERLLKTMVKKYFREPEAWVHLGNFYFRQDKLQEARFTLQRGLQQLKDSSKQNVELSSKFALMEMNFGEEVRGQKIFETIIQSFPRRLDIWTIYVDSLVKKGNLEAARDVFERMTELNLPPKRMKAVFKKFLDFELAQGNESNADAVRKKALNYVHNQQNKGEKGKKIGNSEEDEEMSE